MNNSEKFMDVLDLLGYSYRPYSGRGMYGKKCIGIVVESGNISNELFSLGANLGSNIINSSDDNIDFSWQDIGRVEFDSLGMDQIIYFPNMEYPNDSQE